MNLRDVTDCIRKLEDSPTYSTLYDLEEDLNNVGLTVQTSTGNRVLVAKIVDGRPCCESVARDYMFIGPPTSDDRIDELMLERVSYFIKRAAGEPGKVDRPKGRSWQDTDRLYALPVGHVSVMNEDIQCVVQDMIFEEIDGRL